MCQVLDKIKFCTCSEPVEELENYWVLHRWVKDKYEYILGLPVMPYSIENPAVDLLNRDTLLKRFNEPDAFDIELQPKPKDRLQLTFKCDDSMGGYITYGFAWKNGRWIEEEYDYFDWHNSFDEVQYGKLTFP